MEVGPRTTKSAAEENEDPSQEVLKATIEWSIEVSNAELANFYFTDSDGVTHPHIQLMDTVYSLNGLSESQVDAAQDVLAECVDEVVEPERDADMPYILVGINATVETHQELLEWLLSEVYSVDLNKIERVERSTVEETDDESEEPDVSFAICTECGETYEDLEFIMNMLNADFYKSQKMDKKLGEGAVDIIYRPESKDWICVDCTDQKGVNRLALDATLLHSG
jgi:hypothetical protein